MQMDLRKTISYLILVLFVITSLNGCTSKKEKEKKIDKYIKEVTAQPAKQVESIPEATSENKITYEPKKVRDPFLPLEETQKAKNKQQQDRPKEPLEAFPLDSLHLVGTIDRGNKTWAVILAPDNKIFHIQVGNYIGENNGRITKITPSRVYVEEMIANSLGGWDKRQLVLKIK